MKFKTGNYGFVFMLILYLAVRVLRWKKIIIPWVNSYLDDILCMPILLSILLFIIRKWVMRKTKYYFSAYHILFATLYISWVFEGYLPKHNLAFTSDPYDILAYFTGGFLFYFYMLLEKRGILS